MKQPVLYDSCHIRLAKDRWWPTTAKCFAATATVVSPENKQEDPALCVREERGKYEIKKILSVSHILTKQVL